MLAVPVLVQMCLAKILHFLLVSPLDVYLCMEESECLLLCFDGHVKCNCKVILKAWQTVGFLYS